MPLARGPRRIRALWVVPLALWSATPTIQVCSVSVAALSDDQLAACLVAQLWGCPAAARSEPATSCESTRACDAPSCGAAACEASCDAPAGDASARTFCVGDPTGGSGLLPQAGTDSAGPSLLAATPELSAPVEVEPARPVEVSSPRPELEPWRSAGPIRGPPLS